MTAVTRSRAVPQFCAGAQKMQRMAAPPDFAYAKEGVAQHARYAQMFQEKVATFCRFPQLFKDYFHVSSVMQAKGLVPFVHGVSSSLRAPRIFLETLNQRVLGDTCFRYLRPPSASHRAPSEEVHQKLKESARVYNECVYTGNRGPLDFDPATAPHLVSVSYSMMDFDSMESTFSFLFANKSASTSEEMREFTEAALGRSMQRRGKQQILGSSVREIARLSDEYQTLPHGTLFVVGVRKEMLDQVTYDSEEFGMPTGQKTSAVVAHLGGSSRAHAQSGGLQARVMMCRETMDPGKGVIEVVDVNDAEEVERYCGDAPAPTPPAAGHPLACIYQAGTSQEETAVRKKQKELDGRVRQLVETV